MNDYNRDFRAMLAITTWFRRYGRGYPKAVFHASTACEILTRKQAKAKSTEAYLRLQAMKDWCAL